MLHMPASRGGSPVFDLFVSYRRKDSPPVLELADALVESGLQVWIDQREIADFDAITEEIRSASRSPKRCWPGIRRIIRNRAPVSRS